MDGSGFRSFLGLVKFTFGSGRVHLVFLLVDLFCKNSISADFSFCHIFPRFVLFCFSVLYQYVMTAGDSLGNLFSASVIHLAWQFPSSFKYEKQWDN